MQDIQDQIERLESLQDERASLMEELKQSLKIRQILGDIWGVNPKELQDTIRVGYRCDGYGRLKAVLVNGEELPKLDGERVAREFGGFEKRRHKTYGVLGLFHPKHFEETR